MLKAALAAAAQPVPNPEKKIHQHHFLAGIEQVIAAKRVMQQSIFVEPTVARPETEISTLPSGSRVSQLLTYGLPGTALILALIALAVALLK